VGKPEGTRPFGRPRRGREDNSKMDLQVVGCGDMEWIDLVQDMDRWVGTCECGNVPSGSIKLGKNLD